MGGTQASSPSEQANGWSYSAKGNEEGLMWVGEEFNRNPVRAWSRGETIPFTNLTVLWRESSLFQEFMLLKKNKKHLTPVRRAAKNTWK